MIEMIGTALARPIYLQMRAPDDIVDIDADLCDIDHPPTWPDPISVTAGESYAGAISRR